jgi:hypothetical protein
MWKRECVRGFIRHAKKDKTRKKIRKGALKMEVLNLVLFGCVFYLALIGIPSLCEKRSK